MSLGMEVGLVPGHIVLDGDTTAPRKRAQQSPIYGPMSVVAKLSPISATAELLSVNRMASLSAFILFTKSLALRCCKISHDA